MKVNLSNLFNGSNEVLEINYKLSLSDLLYGTYCPIKNKVSVSGKAYSKADIVFLDIAIDFTFNGFCDRCVKEIVNDYNVKLHKILVRELSNNEDCDDYIVVKNETLNLDSLVEEEIQLFLPSKMLCNEDCNGLCHKCGKNLNDGICDCKSDVDPRMASLLQLLDEE